MLLQDGESFIGRRDEIEWLKNAWSEARQGRPQVCVLRGESGFGKTGIVQAFYSWLSSDAQQDPEGYWPDVLLKEGDNLRLNPPPASFGGGKAMPWLWWGVRWMDPGAHNRGELSSCAFIDGLSHLEPHREALLARRQQLKRASKAAAELGAVAGELLSFGVVGATKSLVELILLWREERHGADREQLGVEERQAAALQGQIDGLFDFLRGLLIPAPRLPLILVADDAHWIDSRSLQLVERLLRGARAGGWPLLFIATHWEQDWNLQAQPGAPDSFPALHARLASDRSEGDAALAMAIRDIDRLPGLEDLVRQQLPGLAEDQVAFLAARADGNPRLMNEILLELRDEPSYFEDGDLRRPLTAEALAELERRSFALHEVQKRRFRRLDEGLRKLLAYGSYQGMRFLRELALEAAQVLDSAYAPDLAADSLDRAVQPYAVLAAPTAVIHEFRHRVFHDLARERFDRMPKLGASLGDALLTVAGAWLDAGRVYSLPPADQEGFYLLMLEQPSLAESAFPHLALRLMAGLFGLYRETGYLARAREWSDMLAEDLPLDGRIPAEVLSPGTQLSVIYMWLELDQREAGRRLAQGLVETCRDRVAGRPDDPDFLRDHAAAEVCLGDVLLAADEPAEARRLYENSLATRERILAEFGESAERLRDLSVSQFRVAMVVGQAGEVDLALKLLTASESGLARVAAKLGTASAEAQRAQVAALIEEVRKAVG